MSLTFQTLGALVEASTGLDGIQITETSRKEALICHVEKLYEHLTVVLPVYNAVPVNCVMPSVLACSRGCSWQ